MLCPVWVHFFVYAKFETVKQICKQKNNENRPQKNQSSKYINEIFEF